MKAEAICTNPDQMKIGITVEMSLPEWKYLLDITNPNGQPMRYYGPLEDIRTVVAEAIRDISGKVEARPAKT